MAAEVRAGSRASRHHPSETERYVHSVTPLLVTPGRTQAGLTGCHAP